MRSSDRVLQVSPGKRYQTAAEMQEEVTRIVTDPGGVPAKPVTKRVRGPKTVSDSLCTGLPPPKEKTGKGPAHWRESRRSDRDHCRRALIRASVCLPERLLLPGLAVHSAMARYLALGAVVMLVSALFVGPGRDREFQPRPVWALSLALVVGGFGFLDSQIGWDILSVLMSIACRSLESAC